VAVFYLAAQCFLMIAPFLRPPGGVGDTSLPYWLSSVIGIVVLVAGALWWAVWCRLLPAVGKYGLVARHERLADGTAVVVYEKVKEG
jgi:hypothetical protein